MANRTRRAVVHRFDVEVDMLARKIKQRLMNAENARVSRHQLSRWYSRGGNIGVLNAALKSLIERGLVVEMRQVDAFKRGPTPRVYQYLGERE